MADTTFTLVHGGRMYGYRETGPKWRCDVCGRSGYGDPHLARERRYGSHWSDSCWRGHAPCPWCGRQLALRMDGTPRVHSRCPERPAEVEVVRTVAAEVRQEARLAVRGPHLRSPLLDHLTNPHPTEGA